MSKHEDAYKVLMESEGLWRVDAIGRVWPRVEEDSEVDIFFSEIFPESKTNPFGQNAVKSIEPLIVRRSVAELFLYAVGTLWTKKNQITYQPHWSESFEIDTTTGQKKLFGEPMEFGDGRILHLVPNSHFQLERKQRLELRTTWLHVLPVSNNRYTQLLLIPATEVFRFYYGVSTNLIRKMLSGEISKLIDWRASTCSLDCIRLVERTRLTRLEAYVLARAKYWEQAHNPIFVPRKSLTVATAEYQRNPYPGSCQTTLKSDFPFLGQTRIHVTGKRIPLNVIGGDPIWAAFVTQILHCQRPFEFSKLERVQSTPVSQPTSERGPPVSRPLPVVDPFDETFDDPLDNDPADQRIPRHRVVRQRFAAIEPERVEIIKVPEMVPPHTPPTAVDVQASGHTLSSGNYTNDARNRVGQDWTDTLPERASPYLEIFLAVMRHVQQRQSAVWDVHSREFFRAARPELDRVVTFPAKKGNRFSWHIIAEGDSEVRFRQVAWVEVIARQTGQRIYVAEMELKPEEGGQCTLIFHSSDFSAVSDQVMQTLLELTSVQNRWPHEKNSWRRRGQQRAAEKLFASFRFIRLAHRTSVDRTKNHTNSEVYVEARGLQIINSLRATLDE